MHLHDFRHYVHHHTLAVASQSGSVLGDLQWESTCLRIVHQGVLFGGYFGVCSQLSAFLLQAWPRCPFLYTT